MNKRIFNLVIVISIVLGTSFVQGCAGSKRPTVNFGRTIHLHNKQQRIAVLPFVNASGEYIQNPLVTTQVISNSGETVASILAESLITVNHYSIIERSKLKSVLDEHGLSAADFIEKKGSEEAGRLFGADAIVIGNVSRCYQTGGAWYHTEVGFSARCVDINTGEVVWSVSPHAAGFGSVTDYIREICKNIAMDIKKKLSETSR